MREAVATLTKKLQPVGKYLFALLPVSLFLVECFAYAFLGSGVKLWPLVFGALWALILGSILFVLPRLAARITFGVIYYLSLLYAGIQTGYYFMFGGMIWISDCLYASEAADYANVLLSYPVWWWITLVAMAVWGGFLLWKFPRWERKRAGYAIAAGVCAVSVVGAFTLPELEFYLDYQQLKDGSYADTLAGGDYARMQSAEAAYENMFNAYRLYQTCGLNQMLCKDIYTNYLYPLTPAYARAQKEATEELDNYFADREEGQTNDMTGLLEGKNVILVLMESMDDWMIGEHTPTIAKLMEEGINFTQFYTPLYGSIRTFNTEFCINTGSFLSNDGGYAFDYVTNDYSQSLANQLKNAGYSSAMVFHYNDPAFYSRGVYSLAMGYDQYVCYKDYVTAEEWKTAQYDDTLLFTNSELCDLFFRQEDGPTFNFIITRSAHLTYSYNEVLSNWGLSKYPEYRYLTEDQRTNCALLKAKLVDDMFAALLEELEARGQLENTVIIGVTDHYTYGYRVSGSLELDYEAMYSLSGVDYELLLEKTPCFIWSADMEAMEVDKTVSTADLLPTVLNLMGVEGEYSYLGRDIFDDSYAGMVYFSDGSWICGNLAYDTSLNQMFTLDGTDPADDPNYATAVSGIYDQMVADFVKRNNLILKANYYKD